MGRKRRVAFGGSGLGEECPGADTEEASESCRERSGKRKVSVSMFEGRNPGRNAAARTMAVFVTGIGRE
jgi:hypothetical protein